MDQHPAPGHGAGGARRGRGRARHRHRGVPRRRAQDLPDGHARGPSGAPDQPAGEPGRRRRARGGGRRPGRAGPCRLDPRRGAAPGRARRGPARYHHDGVSRSGAFHRRAGPPDLRPRTRSTDSRTLRWLADRRYLHRLPNEHFGSARCTPQPVAPWRGAQLQDGTLRMLDQLQPYDRTVHLPHRPPRPAGPLRRRLLRRRLRADALDVRGHHVADRRGRDRQVEGPPRHRERRHPRRRLQVGGVGSPRRVQGPPVAQGGRRGRGLPRAPGGPGGRGRPLQEEGRLHAGLGKDPRGPRERSAGRRHPGQEDQGRRRGEPDGRGRVPAGQPDRAAPGAQHRRAAGPDLRVQDHQAQQAPPEHRGQPPGDPGERAGPQARAPDEGARRRPGAEGRGQEHHRLRRLHRPGRRGRPAPHHRHVLRPRLASHRDGRDRPAKSRSRSSTSTGSGSASASA